jgi:hypothetical protein
MNQKILGLVAIVIAVCAVAVAAYMLMGNQSNLIPTESLDFTVTGSSSCLRFLNDSVPMVYVPFTVAANHQMQLTIEAPKMPGGAGGWVDVYLYRGFWDKGVNNTCVSGDVYPILADIHATDKVVMQSTPYTETFGEATQQSYTVFFLFPPGGQSEFHITLKPA